MSNPIYSFSLKESQKGEAESKAMKTKITDFCMFIFPIYKQHYNQNKQLHTKV